MPTFLVRRGQLFSGILSQHTMCSSKISICLRTLQYQYYSSNADIWEVGVWAGACNEGLDSGLGVWVGIGWLGGIGLEARVSDDTIACVGPM